MSISIHIPTLLRHYCDGACELSADAPNVSAALQHLEKNYPALYNSICDETGAARRHINLFVNSDHVRDRDGLETKLTPGDVLTIMPAVSGGQPCQTA